MIRAEVFEATAEVFVRFPYPKDWNDEAIEAGAVWDSSHKAWRFDDGFDYVAFSGAMERRGEDVVIE